jgi:hypothetical protein
MCCLGDVISTGSFIFYTFKITKTKNMTTRFTNFRLANLAMVCIFLLGSQTLAAQFTETFETETVGSNTFSGGGATFVTVNPLNIATFPNGGSNGNGDNQFLEANGTGSVGEIQLTTAGLVFQLNSADLYLGGGWGHAGCSDQCDASK